MNKNVLLEWTKDITVSALSKNEHTLNEPVGDGVADFISSSANMITFFFFQSFQCFIT